MEFYHGKEGFEGEEEECIINTGYPKSDALSS
jgi:hypothetical protein